MKFKMLTESTDTKLIFRGVGGNVNQTNEYFGGKFYADNPMDASNYGDTIEVYSINPTTKLHRSESSIEYCKDNELMFKHYPSIDKLGGGKIRNLDDAYEELLLNGADPNLAYAMFQSVARQHLEAKGFHGADWSYEDELIPHQYQIWDESVLSFIEKLSEVDANKKY